MASVTRQEGVEVDPADVDVLQRLARTAWTWERVREQSAAGQWGEGMFARSVLADQGETCQLDSS